MTKDDLLDKSAGCLIGVFIGDAMGLPVECMSPIAIRQTFGYVDDFVSNKHHPYPNVAKRSAGTISDDSQLTLAMMHSLSKRGGYSIKDIADSHLAAFDGQWGSPVGWGGTTKTACENIRNNAAVTYVETGGGNGPVIKISPLAIYCVYKTLKTSAEKFTNSFNASLLKKCKEISMITHGDHRCIVATYCQSRMIIRALQDEMPQTTGRIVDLFVSDAEYAESKLNVLWSEMTTLSSRLKEIIGKKESFQTETGVISASICSSKSSFILNSYPLTAYCVAKYFPYKNFKFALTQTVNAGADADSNASMVSAIMGASVGFHAIPSNLIKGLKNFNALLKECRSFIQML